MKIYDKNGSIINSRQVYIHDNTFYQMNFNWETKNLYIILANDTNKNDTYIIQFMNVIGFNMTSCNFWGISPYVLDFEYIEHKERTLIPKLYDEYSKNLKDPTCNLEKNIDYIETAITFKSGDKLIIACEYIVLDLQMVSITSNN